MTSKTDQTQSSPKTKVDNLDPITGQEIKEKSIDDKENEYDHTDYEYSCHYAPRQGECEDCGHLGKLVCVPAHPDYQWGGSLSCRKYICKGQCLYKCPNGHDNPSFHNDGWVNEITCQECQAKWTPKFSWWGLDPEEWHRLKWFKYYPYNKLKTQK